MRYADLYKITEDQRIAMICAAAKDQLVAVFVEDMPKAERYIKKIQKLDPTIRVINKVKDSPVKGVITITVTGATVQ